MEHDQEVSLESGLVRMLEQRAGVALVSTVLNQDFQGWVRERHRLCLQIAGIAMDEARAMQLDQHLCSLLAQTYGPAVTNSGTALAYLDRWLALPAEQFAASVAALLREAGASYRALQPRMPEALRRELAAQNDLMTVAGIVTRDLGTQLLNSRQRQAVFGDSIEQLERHLGGSSYAYLEFLASAVGRNLVTNFLGQLVERQCEQVRHERGLQGGGASVLAGVVLLKKLDDWEQQVDACIGRQEEEAATGGGSAQQQPARSAAATVRVQHEGSAGSAAGGSCTCSGCTHPQVQQQPAPAAGSAAPQQQQQQPAPAGPEGDPSHWRIPQLKAFLAAHGVDTRHCVEKGQLVDLARQALATKAEAAPAGQPSSEPSASAVAVQPAGAHSSSGSGGSRRSCAVCAARQCPDGSKLLLCSGCRSIWYCSPLCQKDDWKRHRSACKKP